ncbi:MAG TPA: bifunctional methylenetetrahydrofolate dehydrogenase/methenyltetrahydrofolate cyclohydrolase [Elusimicrobia bacterium]|nr:bifunctional methylenetetrahydrofolate dehydrogenase/methenyltetrahydrofolate cyclohydrolase [Elusimicrobiota bacterium]HBT62694.1 bifunctional methylenetetrahydrofolate dehydrogenase/methenyltetrahydrofolate cyclohydrolase [Elusimicrobiota bacterium]
MKAIILDGKAVARTIRAALEPEISNIRAARGTPPKLAVVTHTAEESAGAYLRAKLKAAQETGLQAQAFPCVAGTGQSGIVRLLAQLSEDPSIDGIVVEQPLDESCDPVAVFCAIAPAKDVEGVHPLNYGRFFLAKTAAEIAASDSFPPCTVAAMIALLEETGLQIKGKQAVVIGRSEIVGRPAAHYLSALDATVTLCHSRTLDVAAHVRRADIVFACLGRARFIRGAWIKPGAAVIDAGMNRSEDGWVGDVEFDGAAESAAFITPVPGGVGPVTTAVVLGNTVLAARRRLKPR